MLRHIFRPPKSIFNRLNLIYSLCVLIPQLIEEQRRYLKAVKDFQDECNKNEWLLDKIEQLKKK